MLECCSCVVCLIGCLCVCLFAVCKLFVRCVTVVYVFACLIGCSLFVACFLCVCLLACLFD